MYVSITGEKKWVTSKANNEIHFEAQKSQVGIYVWKAYLASLHAHHVCIDTQKAKQWPPPPIRTSTVFDTIKIPFPAFLCQNVSDLLIYY